MFNTFVLNLLNAPRVTAFRDGEPVIRELRIDPVHASEFGEELL